LTAGDDLVKSIPSFSVQKSLDPEQHYVKNLTDQELCRLLENFGYQSVSITILGDEEVRLMELRGPVRIMKDDPNDPIEILSALKELSQMTTLSHVRPIIVLPEEPSYCSDLVHLVYQEAVRHLVMEKGFTVLAPMSSTHDGIYSKLGPGHLKVGNHPASSSPADILIEAETPTEAAVREAGQLSRIVAGLSNLGMHGKVSPADIKVIARRLSGLPERILPGPSATRDV